MDTEGIEKAVLVGMSLGGYPCQMFADLFPDRVAGFIGLDTTPFGHGYYSKADLWWLKQVKPIAKLFPGNFLKKSMAKSVSKTAYSFNQMMEIYKSATKEQIIEQLDIAYGKFPGENRDMGFSCPVLILLGDNDNTGKVKQYCQAWSKRTGYPLHIIKNAGHFSNGDNPEQVNSEIEIFVNIL